MKCDAVDLRNLLHNTFIPPEQELHTSFVPYPRLTEPLSNIIHFRKKLQNTLPTFRRLLNVQ